MIGKILLCLLGVILVLVLIVLRIPAYVRIHYEQGELRVFIKYAWMRIPLFPKNTEKTSQETQENHHPNDTQQKKETTNKNSINLEQILYTLDVLPPVLLKAVKRLGKRIKIEPLKIHILVATSDPADTAILYGKIQAVLAAVLPSLHSHIQIREQDIQLFTDFCEEKMDYIVDAGIGLSPGDILAIAISALGGVLKWLIGFRKRASKEPAAKANQDATAQAESAS